MTKIQFQLYLNTLNIGDTVYDQQPRYIEYNYHPQVIKQIDIENCELLVTENGIDSRIRKFHVLNQNGEFESKFYV